MSGIFPDTGSPPSQAINAQALLPAQYKAGCDPAYYGRRCNPKINTSAMNAVISEITNAIVELDPNTPYDCEILNNLSLAIQAYIQGQLGVKGFTLTFLNLGIVTETASLLNGEGTVLSPSTFSTSALAAGIFTIGAGEAGWYQIAFQGGVTALSSPTNIELSIRIDGTPITFSTEVNDLASSAFGLITETQLTMYLEETQTISFSITAGGPTDHTTQALLVSIFRSSQ